MALVVADPPPISVWHAMIDVTAVARRNGPERSQPLRAGTGHPLDLVAGFEVHLGVGAVVAQAVAGERRVGAVAVLGGPVPGPQRLPSTRSAVPGRNAGHGSSRRRWLLDVGLQLFDILQCHARTRLAMTSSARCRSPGGSGAVARKSSHTPGRPAPATALGLARPSVTALLDRLVTAGYISRTTGTTDRRTVTVALRPATWQAFARVYRPLGDTVQAATSYMPDEDRRVVIDAMGGMVTAFYEVRAALIHAEPIG